MNETQKELLTDWDIYWAYMVGLAPDLVNQYGVKDLMFNAFMNGAGARQDIAIKELKE